MPNRNNDRLIICGTIIVVLLLVLIFKPKKFTVIIENKYNPTSILENKQPH